MNQGNLRPNRPLRPRLARKQPVTRGERVGGRSERVVADVLHAAAAELARVGYAGFRIEDVATAAGVNKTTVYRRWPTKADLVEATLRGIGLRPLEVPDTGSIDGDLTYMLRRLVSWQKSPEGAGAVRMLMLEIGHPEVERIVRTLRAESLAPWYAVTEAAKKRGDLPPEADARMI